MRAKRKKGQVIWRPLKDILQREFDRDQESIKDEQVRQDAMRSRVEMFGHPEDYEGIEVGFRHLGPKELRKWEREFQTFRIREVRRINAMREDLGSLHASWLESAESGTPKTSEGIEEMENLVANLIEPMFEGVRGWDDIDAENPDDARVAQMNELSRLSLLEMLIDAAQEAQRPRAAVFPVLSGAGSSRQGGGQDSGVAS